jgi:hypothetical protein
MTTKLTRVTHKIAIQLHLVAESCTICSSRSRWPVRKLLDTPSYLLYDSQEIVDIRHCSTERHVCVFLYVCVYSTGVTPSSNWRLKTAKLTQITTPDVKTLKLDILSAVLLPLLLPLSRPTSSFERWAQKSECLHLHPLELMLWTKLEL